MRSWHEGRGAYSREGSVNTEKSQESYEKRPRAQTLQSDDSEAGEELRGEGSVKRNRKGSASRNMPARPSSLYATMPRKRNAASRTQEQAQPQGRQTGGKGAKAKETANTGRARIVKPIQVTKKEVET